jgi:hypothetical protein
MWRNALCQRCALRVLCFTSGLVDIRVFTVTNLPVVLLCPSRQELRRSLPAPSTFFVNHSVIRCHLIWTAGRVSLRKVKYSMHSSVMSICHNQPCVALNSKPQQQTREECVVVTSEPAALFREPNTRAVLTWSTLGTGREIFVSNVWREASWYLRLVISNCNLRVTAPCHSPPSAHVGPSPIRRVLTSIFISEL